MSQQVSYPPKITKGIGEDKLETFNLTEDGNGKYVSGWLSTNVIEDCPYVMNEKLFELSS